MHVRFRRHEPTLLTALCTLLTLPLITITLEATFSPSDPGVSSLSQSPWIAITRIIQEYLVFYVSLAASIIIYRLSPWHPFAQYPGPLGCKISKLWMLGIAFPGDTHTYINELHKRYGPIVRTGETLSPCLQRCTLSSPCLLDIPFTGPNELHISDKDMMPHILGTQGMPKGPRKSPITLPPRPAT